MNCSSKVEISIERQIDSTSEVDKCGTEHVTEEEEAEAEESED
jgi:hypothetical protein